MSAPFQLVSLFAPSGSGLTPAGVALAEEVRTRLSPHINALLNAGYDPQHIENVVTHEISFLLVMGKLNAHFVAERAA